jgi:hypothetical protein
MRRPLKKAVLALTLLGVHALGLLASTYDFHAHAHQICPEHGEVVHSLEAHAPIVSFQSALENVPESHHAHCALAPHFRPGSGRISTPKLDAIRSVVSFAGPTAIVSPYRFAIALYALAPKNSPPA